MLISFLMSMLLGRTFYHPDGEGGGGGDDSNEDPPADDDGEEGDDDDGDDDTEIKIKNPKALLSKHRKIQSENKRLRDALAAKEKAEREAEEKKIKESGDHKALAEAAEKRAQEAEAKANDAAEKLTYMVKVSAFRQALGAGVTMDPKYTHLIDTDAIEHDDETGEIDQASLTKAVKEFKKNYPEVLRKANANGSNGSGIPNDAPGNNATGAITLAEYNAMSLADKKKNYKRMLAGLKSN